MDGMMSSDRTGHNRSEGVMLGRSRLEVRTSADAVDRNLALAQPTPDPPRPLFHQYHLFGSAFSVGDEELERALRLICSEHRPTGRKGEGRVGSGWATR